MITVTESFNVQLTVEELASEFCGMGADQQAVFFNQIALISAEWKNPLCFQLHNIMMSEVLTPDGRWVMEQIGIYSSPLSEQAIIDTLKEE